MTAIRSCLLFMGGFALLGMGAVLADFGATEESGPTWHFESATPGELPAGWRSDGTAQDGPLATWAVTADSAAPSGGNVLGLTATNHQSPSTFNLCWTPAATFFDGAASVRFKVTGGGLDPGAGIVWRVQDRNDYYLCYIHPADRSVRVCVVSDGRAKELASTTAAINLEDWHALTVQHAGDRIACSLDGKQLLSVKDDRILREGGVGFWTAADTTALFDDLAVAVDAEKAPAKKPMPKERTRQGTRYLEGS